MQQLRAMRRRHSSGWWGFLIICMAGGAFWWFGGWDATKNIGINGAETSSTISLKEKGLSIFGKITAVPGQVVSEVIGAASQATIQGIKRGAAEVLGTVEQQFGLPPAANNQVNEMPFEVALQGATNTPLVFVVGAKGGDNSYVIDWNDGQNSRGEIPSGEKRTIAHQWTVPGSYLVNATLTNKEHQVRRFSIPVSIE